MFRNIYIFLIIIFQTTIKMKTKYMKKPYSSKSENYSVGAKQTTCDFVFDVSAVLAPLYIRVNLSTQLTLL